ncbi:MAG TPA: hypothetical protein VK518_04895 [Puia sp.]|nr:hypothetical protein [Puia sp.]
MGNNPILHSDFGGDTAIIFGANGNFLRFQNDGRQGFSGKAITGVSSKVSMEGGAPAISAKIHYRNFKLNDPSLAAQAVKNGVMNRVEFISNEKIQKQLDRSGVESPEAQNSPISYAWQGAAGGLMDYAIAGARAADLNQNTLYVTGDIGYDIADFGNFLFGRGMADLGVSYNTTVIGAQYNHIFNNRFRSHDAAPIFDLGPGTFDPNNPGWFDAETDQRAIFNGYSSSPREKQRQNRTWDQIDSYMKGWHPNQN